MKKIISILLILLLTTGCGKKDDTLVMVTEAGFAPYEYYENGEIVGVDIDIAKEIASSMGKKLEIKDVAFDSIINELKSGKADMALAGMSITEERLKEVDFSTPYVESRQIVMVNNNSQITSTNDIFNKKIAVQLGSIADITLSNDYDNLDLSRQKKYLSMTEDLKREKVDCIVMDYLPAKEIIKNNKDLKILEGELFSDTYGIAVKKDNKKLLDSINKTLKKLQEEGKIDEFVLNHSK